MMTEIQNALTNLLLSSFPTFQSGDQESAITAYEWVMNSAEPCDVQPGVMILLNGQYPGHDGRFAPTAPQLATAIRMAAEKRYESERRDRVSQPQLPPPPPDVVHTPEERARAKAMVDAFVARVAENNLTEDAAATKRRNAQLAKTNARFDPDQSDAEIGRRLMKYTVGDADGEADAA